jgi:TolB-like protein
MLIAVKAMATMLVSLKSFLSLHSFLSFLSYNPINPINSRNTMNPINSKNLRNCVNFLLLALCLLLIFIYGCGGPKYHIRSKADISAIKRVAVLPLENFTADTYAGEKIRRLVISELLSRGIDVIEPGEVTRLLKESEVRSLGSIKVSDIQNTGKTLGVEAVMLGSVEAFGMGRGISVTYPEVSIHLMLLEASSGKILWSGLHTTGGAGFWTRHFGAEGISLSEAARRAVKKAVSTLF